MAKTAGKYIKSLGSNISAKELQQVEKKFGAPAVEKARSYAKETPGVRLGPGAHEYYKTFTGVSPGAGAGVGAGAGGASGASSGEGGVSGGGTTGYGEGVSGPTATFPEMDTATRIALQTIMKDTELEKQKLYNEGWAKAQGISAEATRYVSDREKEAILGKADIETRGRIDLQGIINAGLKDVAGIEAQSARDVATIGGEFGVKQEQTRQTGQKDIARIGARAGILQGLVGAFNF